MKSLVIIGVNPNATKENMQRLLTELLETVKFEKIILAANRGDGFGIQEWAEERGLGFRQFDERFPAKSEKVISRLRNAAIKSQEEPVFVVAMREKHIELAKDTALESVVKLNFERWFGHRYEGKSRGLSGVWNYIPKL